jgi:exopolysaccharide biosynthesis polyprenyl glycosylphosphotransferase
LGFPLLSRKRLIDAAMAISVGVLALGGCSILLDISLVSPPFLLIFWLAGITFVLSARILIGRAVRLLRTSSDSVPNILVVGTGPRAIRFARGIEEDEESVGRIVGFVDADWPGMRRFRDFDLPLVSDYKELPGFLRSNIVDELVIALPLEALGEHRAGLIEMCRVHGVNVRFLSSVFVEYSDRGGAAESPHDEVVLTLYNAAVDGWPHLIKRVADIGFAAILLVLLAPVLLVTSLLIALVSPGPILFTQQRVGLNKRLFRMYKFRTMRVGAESQQHELEHLNEVEGAAFKVAQDPRVTPIGRILRSWSIDELPQLLNVLKGEMSLIGPRPLPLRDFERFDGDEYRRRFSVRPGMTGLWQVSGRSATSFDRWMKLDLQYVDEWTLRMDFQILARTIPAVLRREGAA